MPHTTHAYPFERKVCQFLMDLSTRFSTGPDARSFVMRLDTGGNVTGLEFDDETGPWRDKLHELESSGMPYLLYDPIDDGMEYTWVGWHLVAPSVMERLTGQSFVASDFQRFPHLAGRAEEKPPSDGCPSSWGVMF